MSAKFVRSSPKLMILSAICGILPDFDVLAFKFHIPYSSVFGHRGFSHSILFAALMALIFTMAFFSFEKYEKKIRLRYFMVLFAAMLSHSVLDAFTDGGLGVAFLSPFINDRYFSPFQFIPVAPISPRKFFSDRGLSVILSEIVFVWFPLVFIFLLTKKKSH